MDNTISYTAPGDRPKLNDGILAQSILPLVSEDRDIRFARIVAPPDVRVLYACMTDDVTADLRILAGSCDF